MFLKTKRKIVFSIMAFLVLFLALTLATIYGTNYANLIKQNTEMLERYVSIYSPDSMPGKVPPAPSSGEIPPALPPDAGREASLPDPGDLYRLSSFYSAAISGDGTVLAVDTGSSGIYDEAEILERADRILKSGSPAGKLDRMIYQVEQREEYTLVAFMDTTVTESSMSSLLVRTLAVGIAAIAVFSVFAVYLANRIVRPLEDSDRRQKQFVSDAGHELKTPVSVIGANAELLARKIGEDPWLSNIQCENERMGKLIRDLLELSRAESGTMTFGEVDLSRLTEQETLTFESMAYEHGITLNSSIQKNVTVMGNRSRLEQLLSILLDNAVSHNTGNEIGIELKKEYRNAVLTVTNPGEAMTAGEAEKLFDRFTRMDGARGDEGDHFGLGLPIARAIAEAHKGRIGMEWLDGRVICRVEIPSES